jgi:hypothetical protein
LETKNKKEMSTKRQLIESLRKKIQERNADSNFTNKDLYQTLLEQTKWLIKREINSGRIYKNVAFFQTLFCQDVIEVPTIDPCCPVKTNCKIYRTKCKIPDFWIDEDGPIMKSITSVDGTTYFEMTTPTTWQSKRIDPYNRKSKQMYAFYSDGYFWFPEHNPHKINILGFWTDDVSDRNGCAENPPCVRFLDTKFTIPDWLEGELIAKSLEILAGVTKRLPEDEQIDKNTTRKN